jgi:hypothetical protein
MFDLGRETNNYIINTKYIMYIEDGGVVMFDGLKIFLDKEDLIKLKQFLNL